MTQPLLRLVTHANVVTLLFCPCCGRVREACARFRGVRDATYLAFVQCLKDFGIGYDPFRIELVAFRAARTLREVEIACRNVQLIMMSLAPEKGIRLFGSPQTSAGRAMDRLDGIIRRFRVFFEDPPPEFPPAA